MRITIAILALPIVSAALYAQNNSTVPTTGDDAPAAQSDEPAQGDYTGPAILSRSSVLGNFAVPRSVTFRPFAAVNAIYDSEFTGVNVSPNGSIPQYGVYGVQATVGITGVKSTERTSVSLDYRGSYIDYGNKTYFSGTNQFLTLSVIHRLSKHISVSLQEAGTTYNRGFDISYLGNYTSLAYLNNPATEVFDGRTYFLSSTGNVIIQKSARLSFSLGGTGFIVRRQSSALSGVTSYMANGDMNYRLTRRINTGVYYRYTHYEYTRSFGSTDFHTVGLSFSDRFSRRWELGLQGGVSRVEFLGLVNVPVDPIIAAITGQTSGVLAQYTLHYASDASARLTRTMHRGSLSLIYARSVSPGNGLYLASNYQSAGATYDYGGFRRWGVNFHSEYGEYGSLSQGLAPFRSYVAGVGVSRSLRYRLSSFFRGDYRFIDVSDTLFRRNQFTLSLGLAFSPGDRPLTLW